MKIHRTVTGRTPSVPEPQRLPPREELMKLTPSMADEIAAARRTARHRQFIRALFNSTALTSGKVSPDWLYIRFLKQAAAKNRPKTSAR